MGKKATGVGKGGRTRFKKGQPRPAKAGRKKGTPNKATLEIRDFAKSVVEDAEYRRGLLKRLRDGKAPHMEPLLFAYAYGKPKEHVEHGGTIGLALVQEAAAELRDRLARLASRGGAEADPGGAE